MIMRRISPPKHRHDGTSPLPLGMDWSPPPRRWKGQDTVWPHDPRTGWSYCITVPSWVALPKSRSSASDLVVFYRVQVGVQSPEGVTSTRALLRRFNDFLKLFSDLKSAFPKKNLPPAPPKGLLRIKSGALLDERRRSLEEWMTKLLSDINVSRSVAIASFLELEAAARSCRCFFMPQTCLNFIMLGQKVTFISVDSCTCFSFFIFFYFAALQNVTQQPLEADPATNSGTPPHVHGSSSYQAPGGNSSLTSDHGSDIIYEASEVGTPSLGRDDSSGGGMEDFLLDDVMSNPIEQLLKYGISDIEEGILMGESILDQLKKFPKHKVSAESITDNGLCSDNAHTAAGRINNLLQKPTKEIGHTRKHSNECVGSDLSSYKGSEMSNSWTSNLLSEAAIGLHGGSEASALMGSPSITKCQSRNGAEVIIAIDQHPKLSRVLITMQRRIVAAKTDMEDLIARLNQEIAVKEYLTTKINDLEVELKTTKQKSKENLQQALLIENEKLTKMQWDMEELRQKSMEMELKLKSQEDVQLCMNSTGAFSSQEKDVLLQKVDATTEQFNSLLKLHEELEVKSKSETKILVKEVKSLRRSQNELNQQLDHLSQENSELERLLHIEKQRSEQGLATRRKLLHECGVLCSQLQDCDIKSLKDDLSFVDALAVPHILNLLANSDNQIGRLLAEVQHFTSDDCSLAGDENCIVSDDLRKMDDALRKILKDLIADSAKLKKRVNVFIRSALGTSTCRQENYQEAPSGETVREQFLEASLK